MKDLNGYKTYAKLEEEEGSPPPPPPPLTNPRLLNSHSKRLIDRVILNQHLPYAETGSTSATDIPKWTAEVLSFTTMVSVIDALTVRIAHPVAWRTNVIIYN